MEVFCLFFKQDSLLAKQELKALAPGKIKKLTKHYAIVDCSTTKWLDRLTQTKFAGKILQKTSLNKVSIPRQQSFAVRCSKIGSNKKGSKEVERTIGWQINGKVDLKNPKTIIRVFTDDKNYWITKQLFEFSEKQFRVRESNARPVFHPSSLQPRAARLLINLGGPAKSLLDPLCGVGGIILEAGVLGMRTKGVEMDEKWAEGAKENIWFYRLEKKVKVDNADFFEWAGPKYDLIVTDLPYGRSTKFFGKEMEEFYLDALKKFRKHTKKLVVMAPGDLSPLLKKAGWKKQFVTTFHVHRSLKRWIFVAQSA